jgi:3-deoxy-D-manno-octulosonic-acid transferase
VIGCGEGRRGPLSEAVYRFARRSKDAMPGWVLNCVYALLLTAASPVVCWRAWRHGRYRRGWREKLLGSLPVRGNEDRPLVWLHAVSLGEVVLLKSVVRQLLTTRPDVQVLISTSTDTGYDVAVKSFPECQVTWLPLDFTWAVRRAVQRARADMFVLVELELWPNLIRAANAAGLPLALINARVSERSARGYARIRRLIAPLLRSFDVIGVQNAEYAARLLQLGADETRLAITGSVKFDGVRTERTTPEIAALRRDLSIDATSPVFIAGSTQAPEEEAALDAWQAARQTHPNLRLILVPRHPERCGQVESLILNRGLPLLRRSTGVVSPAGTTGIEPIVLIDTVGELSHVWGLADVAYVGGSLTPGRGGQNMLEPAGYGAAVLFGPYTSNFRVIVETLLNRNAARIVDSTATLQTALRELLTDRGARTALGTAARDVVVEQRGATARTIAALTVLLPQAAVQHSSAA